MTRHRIICRVSSRTPTPRAARQSIQEAELGFTAAKNKVGEVTVAVDPTGAQVSVDGADKGVAPLPGPLYLPLGAHSIEARSSDRHASKSVTVSAGQSVAINLVLRAGAQATPAVPPPAASDTAEAQPPEAAPPPPVLEEQPAPVSGEVTSDVGGGRKPFFEWFVDSPLAIVGAIVGVAGVGTGIGLGIAARSDYSAANSVKDALNNAWLKGSPGHAARRNEVPRAASRRAALPEGANKALGDSVRYQDYLTHCQLYTDDANAGDKKKTFAILSTAVGGAALVGVVVYYFLDPHAMKGSASSDAFRARLSPIPLGGGSTGIGMAREFLRVGNGIRELRFSDP